MEVPLLVFQCKQNIAVIVDKKPFSYCFLTLENFKDKLLNIFVSFRYRNLREVIVS